MAVELIADVPDHALFHEADEEELRDIEQVAQKIRQEKDEHRAFDRFEAAAFADESPG